MRRSIALLAVSVLVSMLLLAGCGGGASGAGKPAAGSGGGSAAGGAPAAGAADVTISGFAFGPAEVEIKAGETVTWTNQDSTTHTVKGDGWASGELAPGQTFSHAFDKTGTYGYACAIHPNMTGTVVVK